jgi:hypothetical protein
MIKSQRATMLLAAINQVKSMYLKQGFNITHLLVDGQFDTLHGGATGLGITLNVVSRDEHIPEIKRYIKTVKECVQCIYNTMSFKQMPMHIIIKMVYASVFWLNVFPAIDDISNTMSSHIIITGLKLDYIKHCHLEFGTYV